MSIRPYLFTFVVNLLLLIVIANCATKPGNSQSAAPKGYVSYQLAYPNYQAIFQRLQLESERKLKSRGEAHITIVTPPEFEILKKKIKPDRIHEVASTFLDKTIPFEHVCLGEGEKKIKDQIEKVFFVVVTAPDLLRLRRTLAEEGHFSKNEFDPDLFFPHITLGFTERDLYYEDGVIKNKESCKTNLQPLLASP